MTCLTCLMIVKPIIFTDFSYLTICIFLYFFYSGFYIPCFRIWGDFPSFCVLGFGAIFHHSVFKDLGRFSVIPCFRIWGDFPSFRHSVIPCFRVAPWRYGIFNMRRDVQANISKRPCNFLFISNIKSSTQYLMIVSIHKE